MFRAILAWAIASFIGLADSAWAAPAVEDYGRLPALEHIALSPSGGRYAFVGLSPAGRQLLIATTDNKPLDIIKIDGLKVIRLAWAGEDHVIVQISKTVSLGGDFSVAKQEMASVTVIDLRDHRQFSVFDHMEQVDPAVAGFYGVADMGGHWYGFFGGYSRARDSNGGWSRLANMVDVGDGDRILSDLYRVDLDTGRPELVARGELGGRDWLVGPRGDLVAREIQDIKTGDWRIRIGASGGRVIVEGRDRLAEPDLLGLGRTPDSILIRRNDGETGRLEEWPLAGGEARPLPDDAPADGDPMFDPTTGLWIGTNADGDQPNASMFAPNLASRVRSAHKAFPNYRVQLTAWSSDFGRMIVFTDGGDDSGTYWLVDVAKGAAAILGGVYPTVTPAEVGATRVVDWKAADGLAMQGVLTLPPGRVPKALPVVVMPHGGPWTRDYPGFDYWAQAYASQGYAVFQPNFRASTGYGQAFYEAGYGQIGRKMQTDISDGLSALAAQGIVDPKRACIVGASYGGYAAEAGVTLQHGLYRCAVSVAGLSDPTKFLTYLARERGEVSQSMRVWLKFLGATSRADDLSAISPARHAAAADAPLLLIHGRDDTVSPIEQSDIMEAALKAAGKPVERLTLAGGDHWLLEEDTRIAMLKASVAFVQKYNPANPALHGR